MKIFLVVAVSLLVPFFNLYAELPPELIDAGKGYLVKDVNDSGNIVGGGANGLGALWIKSSNTWSDLLPAPGYGSAVANSINNAGAIVGESSNYLTPGHSFTHVATLWSGAGAGASLGSSTCETDDAFSSAYAISDSGNIAGTSATFIEGYGCTGPFPAGGNPLNLLITNPDPFKGGTSAVDVNSGGVYIGRYPNSTDAGIISGSGVASPIGFNPRRILNDNTIVGDAFGGNGVRKRSPFGVVENISCGASVADANEVGDILTFDFSGNLRLWHEGSCYLVEDLLPDGKTGYNLLSSYDSSLNNLGQIATNAFRPGESGSITDSVAVLLTPKYPLAINVVATPTGSPGEYEFETRAVRGTPVGTTKWDFGDGSAPVNAGVGTKVKKKFTKPGSYSIKATVKDAQGTTAVNILNITVATPTLQIGIVVPDYPKLEVAVGADFVINVNVTVLNDGAGDLSELTFQGGTFTASDGSILSFTTAATSPFTLSPGTGNTYPLNVRAASVGAVELNTILIGKDAAGKSVSASDSKTISVKSSEEVGTGKPNETLVAKITEAQSLLKSLKQNPSKKQKEAQEKIIARLKVLSGELVSYLASHSADISGTSSKVNLTKLASAAKKSLEKALKRKSSFGDDKTAAKKALTNLQKGILI